MSATLRNAYLVVITTAAFVQIFLGADPLVLVILTAISMSALLGMRKDPVIGDWLFLMFAMYYGSLGLTLKTALLQPVDSNLSEPTLTSLYLFTGWASLTAGYLASAWQSSFRVAWRLDNVFADIRFLRLFTLPIFALGITLQTLHVIFRPQFIPGTNILNDGFGGFGSFYFMLPISVSMQAAICVYKQRNSSDRLLLIAMLLLIAGVSLFGNVKKNIVDAILIVGCSYILFDRARISAKAIVSITIFLGILILYVNPVVHIMRPLLFGLSFQQRLELAGSILTDTDFNPVELADRAARVLITYTGEYSPTGSYFYPNTLNLDRFALILPLDQVIRGLPRAGAMGSEIFSTIPSTVLPSFLIQKEAAATQDLIAWHFGFRPVGIVGRPVVGLIASATAGYGIFGAAILPFIVVFISLRILNRLTGRLKNNPWAISVFSASTLLVEKEIAPFIEFELRDLVLLLGFAVALRVVYLLPARGFNRSTAPQNDLRRVV